MYAGVSVFYGNDGARQVHVVPADAIWPEDTLLSFLSRLPQEVVGNLQQVDVYLDITLQWIKVERKSSIRLYGECVLSGGRSHMSILLQAPDKPLPQSPSAVDYDGMHD
jgi:hypothetical protein